MEDFDIPQNKLAESAERVVDRALDEARRREHALLTNEHVCLAFAQVEWDMFGQVMRDLELNPHEILQALEEHLRLLPSVPGPRPPRRAVDQAAVQAGAAAREPLRPPHDRGDRPVLGDLRGDAGHSGLDHPPPRHRAGGARHAPRHADARSRAARGAPEEALRAAAVPQALRDQPEPARAPGQDSAGLRPRRARWTRCSRSSATASAPTRCCCSASPASARPPSPKGSRAASSSSPRSVPVRLRDCQIVNLQMNTMVAGTMLRGMFEDRIQNVIREIKERPEPDPVHRRSAHDDRRRLGARRAVGRGQRLQVGAGARRGPDHRRDDAQRVQGVHPGRRGARAPLPHRARRRADDRARPARSSTTCGRGSSATTRSASRTRRSRPRSRCRRATCATCSCPTRSSAGSTPRR